MNLDNLTEGTPIELVAFVTIKNGRFLVYDYETFDFLAEFTSKDQVLEWAKLSETKIVEWNRIPIGFEACFFGTLRA